MFHAETEEERTMWLKDIEMVRDGLQEPIWSVDRKVDFCSCSCS